MSDFETKDSGVRELYATGMRRDTEQGKPRFDLMFPLDVAYEDQFLTRFAELLARGAVKYGDRNWEAGYDEKALARAKSSAMRHMVQWLTGEDDEDHAAAVVFNLMQAEYLSLLKPVEMPFDHGDLARSARRALRASRGVRVPLTVQDLNDLPVGSKVEGTLRAGRRVAGRSAEAGELFSLTKVEGGCWDDLPDNEFAGGYWAPGELLACFSNVRVIA